ncbi:MAG: 23S rRNA (adenine(2503)-C(2))-methyltransferase RlmN [Tenericutes bacterium]|nr:23S rRNA (adenine(2503)-C(2))-methyltransferase RlmN [Mycoplasmatota bacterium]
MNIYAYTLKELEEYLVNNGFKKYNATQIIEWIYEHKVYDFNKMTNLSKKLIEFCNENLYFEDLSILKVETSKLANKYLLGLKDNNKIECVLMNHDYGYSLCVSSQVGCNMGCSFCESGRLKKVRDLSLEELVGQVIAVSRYEGVRIDSIVVMGIGEPFDNFENIKRFISLVTNNKMLNIGQRHLTVSTCGLVPKIYEFADLETGVNLAISLHAPNNEIRDKIMKINHAYKIEKVMKALDYYIAKTNRRVTIEYIMLAGINDTDECAYELANLIKGKLMYVNLIPYNETSNFTMKRSNDFKIKSFYDILKSNNINVTIRKEMGGNLSAACGQLRANEEGEK